MLVICRKFSLLVLSYPKHPNTDIKEPGVPEVRVVHNDFYQIWNQNGTQHLNSPSSIRKHIRNFVCQQQHFLVDVGTETAKTADIEHSSKSQTGNQHLCHFVYFNSIFFSRKTKATSTALLWIWKTGFCLFSQ